MFREGVYVCYVFEHRALCMTGGPPTYFRWGGVAGPSASTQPSSYVLRGSVVRAGAMRQPGKCLSLSCSAPRLVHQMPSSHFTPAGGWCRVNPAS